MLVRGWLALVGISTALWGLALFSTADGPSGLIRAWWGESLTSRLIAVMLLTIAVGVAYSMRNAELSRIMLGVIIVYGAGVVTADLWNALANRPVNVAYLAAFGLVFAVSTALLVIESRRIEKLA